MDTHKVPQQIQYKDELLWGMTIRQIILVGLFCLPAYMIFKTPLPLVLKIMLIVPFVGSGFIFAFYPHKGRYLEVWLINWAIFRISPHYYQRISYGQAPGYSALLRRFLKHRREEASPVSSQVPIKGIVNGMIQIDFGYVMVIKTSSLNYHLMSDSLKLKTWSSYRSFLNVLSLGFPIQFHIQVRPQTVDDFEAHFEDVVSSQPNEKRRRLAEAQRDFILDTVRTSSVVSRDFYVVIPYNPSFTQDLGGANVLKFLFSRTKPRTEEVNQDIAFKQLSSRRDQVIGQLKKIGVEAEQLDDRGLLELLYNGYNPSVACGGTVKHDLSGIHELGLGKESMVKFISPSYLRIGDDYADLAGVHLRTIYALDFPSTVYNGWLQPLIDLDQDMDISIHISPMETNSVIKMLEKNFSKMLSTKRYRAHKGKMEDYHVEAKSEDFQYLLLRLIRNDTRMFNMGLYTTVRSLDPDKLDERESVVTATLESMQVVPAVAKYQMAAAVATNLPIAQDRLCVFRNFESDGMADGIPLTSSHLSSEGRICYGLNLSSSGLACFDRFLTKDVPNSNSVVLGASGGGKSYFTKYEGLSYLLQGTYATGTRMPVSVVVIDPEREYEAICEAVGGQYITISRTPKQHINPFDPYMDKVEGVSGIDRQVADAQVLIKLMAPTLEMSKAQLEDLLFEMFHQKKAPLIADLNRLADERGYDQLVQALYPWHIGSCRNIFSHPTDVRLDSDYIVFDISEMDEDLRGVSMQVILSWLWRSIFADPKPRLIYIDEAWCLLQTAGDWFAAAYKRARKHWAGFSINDHEVDLILNSDVMSTILTNSATKVLFNQNPNTIGSLTEAFDLTDGEQSSILGGDPGECLFYAGNSHVSLKVIVPPEFDEFLSTSPSLVYARRAAHV